MPSRPLGSDTVTIRVPTTTIDPNDNTRYFSYADGATIQGCNIQPFLTTEKFQEEFTLEREATRTFFRLFMPISLETLAVDDTYRIVFQDIEYEIHAIPGEWRHFDGRKNHIAVLIKRRKG